MTSRKTPSKTLIVVAGDFNVDVRKIGDGDCGLEFASCCTSNSAVFRDSSLTVDACIAAMGCQPWKDRETMKVDGVLEQCISQNMDDGVWRMQTSMPFFGLSRDAFIETCIHRLLHDDPRLWRLSDAALATLGLWPPVDQLRELGQLLIRCREQVLEVSPAKRRQAERCTSLVPECTESESSSTEMSEDV